MTDLYERKAIVYAGRMWTLCRYFMPSCNQSEWVALCWIADRTIAFDKIIEEIPMRHFINGVFWQGKMQVRPITLSESTLKRAIANLVSKGMITKKSIERRPDVRYSINFEWKCKVFSGVKMNPSWGQNEPSIYNNKKESNNISAQARACEDQSMSPMENVTNALAGATAKTKAAQQTKKSKGNGSSYEKIWQDAQAQAFPLSRWFSWTNENKAQVVAAFKRGNITTEDREPFIIFAVTHFKDVAQRRFSKWLRSPPEVLPIPVFVSGIKTFWEEFEDHRNPNRKLEHRIATAAPIKQADNVIIDNSEELEKLRDSNAKLKAALTKFEQDNALAKRARIKKLIRTRPTGPDPEFGAWRD
jgi:hypothetical protein